MTTSSDPTIALQVMPEYAPHGSLVAMWRTNGGDLLRLTAELEPVLDKDDKPTGDILLRLRLRQFNDDV